MKDVSAPDSLRPGSRVGPWLVQGYAGHGSYGVVYRALSAQAPDSPPVALKMGRFPQDPRFVREAELLSLIQHPSVPRLVDRGWWHADDSEVLHPYLVMEWIHGLPLYEWAREHSPTSRQVVQVLEQLAGALAALHHAGGLHRDVKGHNILVEPHGRAVLMDFGSGTWAGAPPLTDTLMAPGTLEYRSPEALRFRAQHEGEHTARYPAGVADDVYALGVSAYRLVTRHYPPPEAQLPQADSPYRAPLHPRIHPTLLNPRLEPQLAALIERLLANEPSVRGSALELERATAALALHPGAEADVRLWALQTLPKVAEPARAAAPAEAAPSKAEAVAARQRAWAERMAQAGLVAAALAVIGAGVVCGTRLSRQEPPALAWTEPRDGSSAPDAGTQGLGDNTATTRVQEYGVPGEANSKSLATQLPEDPLDGQMRPPCRGQSFVVINGGCWRELKELPPDCGDDASAYEWKNGCYVPIFARSGRSRTSKYPR